MMIQFSVVNVNIQDVSMMIQFSVVNVNIQDVSMMIQFNAAGFINENPRKIPD